MARDLALLSESHDGWSARVYDWDAAWVTLGRFQRAEDALLPGAPVQWVTRPTGGRAVLHGHDVTLGIAVQYRALGLADGTRDLRSVYRAVVRPLAQALSSAGLPAVLAEDRTPAGTPKLVADCFTATSPNDIVSPLTGLKVCGCALRLYDSAVLLQASVPIGPPRVDPSLVFAQPAPECSTGLDRATFAAGLAEQLSWALETVLPVNL